MEEQEQAIQLSDAEKSRLERILSVRNLERQRRVAYPFWVLAGVLFIASVLTQFSKLPLLALALGPLGLAALMIGMARYGYYKLFRLLHYQDAIIRSHNGKASA